MWTAYIKMCVRVQKRLNEPYIAEKILTTRWPPQGFRSVALSERRRLTLPLPYATWFVQFQKKIRYPPFAIVFTRDRRHKLFFFNPQSGRENRQWPPFQLGGVARVTTPFKKKRKGPCHSTRFLSCLPQNVSWHKSPRTRISALPQHCQQMWPPFFFSLPLLKKGKKKEKLNSPLPCQLK